MRTVKEEEDMILEIYRQYKVTALSLFLILSHPVSLCCQKDQASLRGARGRSMLLQCLEVLVFTVLILTLPTIILATEILFYFGTIYIDTKLLGKLDIFTQNQFQTGIKLP